MSKKKKKKKRKNQSTFVGELFWSGIKIYSEIIEVSLFLFSSLQRLIIYFVLWFLFALAVENLEIVWRLPPVNNFY